MLLILFEQKKNLFFIQTNKNVHKNLIPISITVVIVVEIDSKAEKKKKESLLKIFFNLLIVFVLKEDYSSNFHHLQ
jgi:hypothetical protein